MTQVTHVILPEHWASFLINGDGSGLTDKERLQAAQQADLATERGEWSIVDVSDGWFSWHYPLYDLSAGAPAGGQVAEYTLLKVG